MYHHPDEFSEYREYKASSNDADYAHPEYYDHTSKQLAPTVQPKLPPTSAAEYSHDDSGQMSEYRGPQELEGYTTDVGVVQREAAERGTLEGGKTSKRGLAGIGGLLAAAVAWLLKLKGLAVFIKFGPAIVSALVSIVIYSLLFKWTFAVGLVALLFLHEMGHAVVMKLKGIPIGGMIFIPLFGAAVTMRQMPQNACDEAEVGIAGPIAGAIASFACLFIAQAQPHIQTVWAPLAYFGFFMNLMNLLPIVPLDGGRVVVAIDRRVWILGFLGLLGFQVWSWLHGNFSLILLLIVIMMAFHLWSRGLAPSTPAERAYNDIPLKTRLLLTVLYFGLAVVLFLGMMAAQTLMPAHPFQ